MNEAGGLLGQGSLRRSCFGMSPGLGLELGDPGQREEREDLEEAVGVGVGDVEEPLVEGIGRGHLGIEPDGIAGRFGEFAPVGTLDQRPDQPVEPGPRGGGG